MSTGDRVRVELEPEVFQAVQDGRGGWNDLMLNVCCIHANLHFAVSFCAYLVCVVYVSVCVCECGSMRVSIRVHALSPLGDRQDRDCGGHQ